MPWTLLGLTFSAGQNPYAALFLLAVLARSDNVELSLQSPFTFLTHTGVIAVLFALAGAQVLADKHPRWARAEALASVVARPLSAVVIAASLLDMGGVSAWLWLGVALVVAVCSHYFRVRLRRQLAQSMAGMGYFLASLMLDSAALITGLLAVLVPALGALLGALMLGGSAAVSLKQNLMPQENSAADPAENG